MFDVIRAADGRAQSPTVGFALLVGLTLISVTAVLVLGGAALSDMEATAKVERAETAMTQFDARAARVALGLSETQTVDVEAGGSGHVTASTRGRFIVRTDEGTEYINQTMGTLEYQTDGGLVAYQGGGVWRGTGRHAVMVSPPEFHYSDGTVTVPLVVVEPVDRATADGSIVVSEGQRDLGLGPGALSDRQVTVEIQSDYYAAWQQFFEQRVPGVETKAFPGNQTVLVDLGHLTIDGDYETGLVSAGTIAVNSGSTVNSETREHANLADLSGLAELIDDAEADATNVEFNGTGGHLDAGAYYTGNTHLTGNDVTMDLQAGNVTLYVDGFWAMSNSKIRVVNGHDNHYAKVFIDGDFAMAQGQSGVEVESGNATRFQMFGTPDMQFAMGQTGPFTGSVYAPRSSGADPPDNRAAEILPGNSADCGADVCVVKGNTEVNGVIVGGEMQFSQSATFNYAEELRHVSPSLPPDADLPPDLTYLHLSANEIHVGGARVVGPEIAGVATPVPSPATGTATVTPTAGGATPTLSPTPQPPSPSAPTVDSLGVTDASECKGNDCNGHDYAEFAVSWSATDPDGDLSSVTVTVSRAGSTVATYSGSSGSETYHEGGAYGDGAYTVEVVAEDASGHSACRRIVDPTANGGGTDQTETAC